MKRIIDVADDLLLRHPIRANAYFASLCDGSMSRETFIGSQRQFFHAVGFFSRTMAALAARLPDSASRAALIHNLAEEHGLDGGAFNAGLSHDRTFAQFLATLGAKPAPSAGLAVSVFNFALLGACTAAPAAYAFGALGMIEYMFAAISAIIGNTVVERGWVGSAELVHYTLHAEIDRRHSAEFFDAIEVGAATEASDGLAFGRQIFDRLYTELLTA